MGRIEIRTKERQSYRTRIYACVAASLLLAIAAVRFWPAPQENVPDIVYDARAQEVIQVEEIQQTQQQARRPPPPRPLTPVIVPDDLVLDEVEIELTDNLITSDSGDDNAVEEDGADVPVSGGTRRPDAGPRPYRVVQPEYTREAQRRNIRAEVIVEVLVNKQGRVERAEIVNRYLLKGKDDADREPVDALGYGLEDAAVAAASKTMFRPARQSGKTVDSMALLTFRFGT